jgi:hypothetical protein
VTPRSRAALRKDSRCSGVIRNSKATVLMGQNHALGIWERCRDTPRRISAGSSPILDMSRCMSKSRIGSVLAVSPVSARRRSAPRPHGVRDPSTLLDSVPLPQPFNLASYIARVEQLRQTKIEVHPAPTLLRAGAPCGLWISIRGFDFIFHAPSSAAAYVRHIVFHELGHLLWEHTSTIGLTAEYAARLLPNLDAAQVVSVLGRASYTTVQEREAELFARKLATAVRLQGPRDESQQGALGAIDRLLG